MYARHRFTAERNAGDGGAGMSDTLAEFEAGDWKLERRWRLLAFDGQGVVIADYDFKGGRVHSLERSASVRVAAAAAALRHPVPDCSRQGILGLSEAAIVGALPQSGTG
jgi:hypothetical protein